MTDSRFVGGVLAARVHRPEGMLTDTEADQQRRQRRELISQISTRFHGQPHHTPDGGVLAVFDSVNAAATAAVTLQRQYPSAMGSLTCAVTGGEIERGPAGFDGAPVDAAIELVQLSGPGQVAVSPLAHRLCGNRLEFPVESGDQQSAQLTWQPAQLLALELQLPAALTVHDDTTFVGRHGERKRLQTMMTEARSGRPQWCSVVGSAGLGKTRLLSELAGWAKGQGIAVVGGSADEDRARSFAPVTEALTHVLEQVSQLSTRLGPGAGDLVRLLPQIAERIVDLPAPVKGDSHTERQALFQAVAGWLRSLSNETPVLLILDSLHWESDSTFDLLRHVARSIGHCPILIVTSHRPDDQRTDGLLATAAQALGDEHVSRIDLGGLESAEVAEYLGHDEDQDAAMLTSVMEITHGSPLHLNELKRRPGALESSRLSLDEVVQARIDLLEPRLRQVLEIASVAGEVFYLKDLVALTDSQADAAQAVDQSVEEGLVHLIDAMGLRYRFGHSLTREVCYRSIGVARRAQLHLQAAVAIEGQGQGAVRRRLNDLARHYRECASLGYEDQAVDYARQAGEAALAQFANEMALSHFKQGRSLLSDDGNHEAEMDLLTGLGRAMRRLGNPDYRKPLVAAADRAWDLKDAPRMAVAVIAAYRGSYTRALHVDEAAVGRIRKALELLGNDDPRQRSRLLALLAIELTWAEDRNDAIDAIDQAVVTARRGAPDLLLEVLTRGLWVRFHPFSSRLALADEIERLTQPDTDPRLKFEIASHEIFSAIRLGERPRLARAREAVKTLVEQVDQPGERSMALLRETTVALMEGRFADTMAHMAQRRALAKEIGEADGEAAFRIHQFWLAFEQATPEQCRELVAMAGHRLEPRQRFFAWPTLLMPACDTGHQELAAQIVSTLSEEGFEQIPRDQMWLWNVCQLAYGVFCLKRHDDADSLLKLLLPQQSCQASMVFNTLGSVQRYIGLLKALLGDLDAAGEHLALALADNQQLGAVTWAARCQLDLARLEQSRGNDPQDLFRAVQSTVAELKLPLLGHQLALAQGAA